MHLQYLMKLSIILSKFCHIIIKHFTPIIRTIFIISLTTIIKKVPNR